MCNRIFARETEREVEANLAKKTPIGLFIFLDGQVMSSHFTSDVNCGNYPVFLVGVSHRSMQSK